MFSRNHTLSGSACSPMPMLSLDSCHPSSTKKTEGRPFSAHRFTSPTASACPPTAMLGRAVVIDAGVAVSVDLLPAYVADCRDLIQRGTARQFSGHGAD